MDFKINHKLDLTEDEIFSELHHFLLRKNHRIFTNEQVQEKTGVSANLIHKWVKNGKLKPTIFPNLGYPCECCGKITNHSKICISCSTSITSTLAQEEKDEQWFKQIQQKGKRNTYYYK